MKDFVIENISKVENPLAELNDIINTLNLDKNELLNLSLGDPARYMKTPNFVIEKYIEALKLGRTFYEDWSGNKKLKEAVAKRYKILYNVNYNSNDIIITQGVSEALQFTNTSLLSKGEKALIVAPFFTQYLPNILLEGATPIFAQHDFNNNWDINTESLIKTIKNCEKNKPKYILVTNPNNPTGTVPSEKTLKEVVEIAKDNDIFLISDEIYDELLFKDTKFTSVSKLARGVPHMILNGASKNLFATGFRIGFCIIPEEDKKSIELKNAISILCNSRLSANSPAEYAVTEGVIDTTKRKEFLNEALERIEKTSNLAYKLAKESRYLDVVKPNSTFYIFPRINLNELKIRNDKEFTEKLLKEQHLQVLRGSGFGMDGFIRLITLPEEQVVAEAFSRLEKFFKNNKK